MRQPGRENRSNPGKSQITYVTTTHIRIGHTDDKAIGANEAEPSMPRSVGNARE
jgi:hypothetical protein